MDKQDTNQNIESNLEQTPEYQIDDEAFLDEFAVDTDKLDNTTASNESADTTNLSFANSSDSDLSDSKVQAEHSIGQSPCPQQPSPPTITISTDDVTFAALQSLKYPAPNRFFTTTNNAAANQQPKPNETKPQTSTGGFLRDDISVKFMLFAGVALLLAMLFMPWFAESMVYSVNRGAERAKAEAAREFLAGVPTAEQLIPWVVKKVTPSVVSIRVSTQFRLMGEFGVGLGTGVIVDSDDKATYILTNYHVIDKARLFAVQFSDGQTTNDVEVVGFDSDTDIAVLRVNLSRKSTMDWGDSRKINVGEQVIAIGNPFGLGNTVTSGIISATERYNPNISGSRSHEMLQTDTAINPGNSGGPLVNLAGELVGINTTIFSQNGGNQGIGFAIPSLLAKHVYTEIRKNGLVEHGWLGIIMMPTTDEIAKSLDWELSKGVIVREFTPFSPARDAGIKRGDILIKWGDEEIKDPLHLSHLIILSKAGKTETIELIRKGETKKIKVKLGKRPVSIKKS
ncbi:MAG: trypsin-like peptidase domain-containing protein [Planctomycetaceae bacterium]|jgi:serine protease Do|nr:trypsin-like peptidase domain-containing protein [Planctomycetaceae bacterium]